MATDPPDVYKTNHKSPISAMCIVDSLRVALADESGMISVCIEI